MRLLVSTVLLIFLSAHAMLAEDERNWTECAGKAEYLNRVYTGMMSALGGKDDRDIEQVVSRMRGLVFLFILVSGDSDACAESLATTEMSIDRQADATAEIVQTRTNEGTDPFDSFAVLGLEIDQCLADIGKTRLSRLMAEYDANGMPCGWE